MDNVLKVQNYTVLNALKNHQEGEVAYCEDEKQHYIFKDGEWRKVEAKMMADGLQLNLYDLNKQVIEQLPDFNDEQIKDFKAALEIWKTPKADKYYMLYGKEISYFTLFVEDNDEDDNLLSDSVMECLENFEAIKEYDMSGDAVEIWVKTEEGVTVLYLFGYDAGVVTYHG